MRRRDTRKDTRSSSSKRHPCSWPGYCAFCGEREHIRPTVQRGSPDDFLRLEEVGRPAVSSNPDWSFDIWLPSLDSNRHSRFRGDWRTAPSRRGGNPPIAMVYD